MSLIFCSPLGLCLMQAIVRDRPHTIEAVVFLSFSPSVFIFASALKKKLI